MHTERLTRVNAIARPADKAPDANRWEIACFVVLLVAYFGTLPTTLTDADAGEFLVIAKTGGIAHPPGYPLFILICRLLAYGDRTVPLVTMVAAFSATCTAAGGAILVRAARRLVDARASTAAVLLTFLSPEIWRQANAAEPFALNLLLASGVIAAGLNLLTTPINVDEPHLVPWAAAMGLCFGLGLANHHTLALLAPFPAFIAWRWRQHRTLFARVIGAMALAFLVGCAPVATLHFANLSAPLVYGDWPSQSIMRHVLRLDYGTLKLSAVHSAYGENLWHFVRSFPAHTAWVGPVLLLFGVARAREWGKLVWWALLTSTLLVGPAFLALMNIPPNEEPVIVARFFALPMMMTALWIAAGVQSVFSRAPWRYARAVGLLMFAGLLGHAYVVRQWSNRSAEHVYELHVRQMLSVAARPAVQAFVSASDLEDYGLAYGQHVLNLPPAAVIVSLGPFRASWYRERLARQLSLPQVPAANGFVALLDSLNTRMPLFVVDSPEPPLPALFARARPLGGLFVVIPQGANMPSWLDLYESNTEVLNDLSIIPEAARTTPLTGWELRLLVQHRDAWLAVCRGLASEAHQSEAERCLEQSRGFDASIDRLGTIRW